MRERAVGGEFREPEIHAPVLGLISDPLLQQLPDHRDHPLDIARLRGCGKMVRALDPQRVEVREKRVFIHLREVREPTTRRPCAADGLVVHVGQIHHALHLVAARLKVPLEQVLEDVSAKVSDVRVVINRGAAGVHLHPLPGGIERREIFGLARVGIEKSDGHASRGR